MVEGFFDQKTVDAVAVEDEVGSIGVFVSDHAISCLPVSQMQLTRIFTSSMAIANLRK